MSKKKNKKERRAKNGWRVGKRATNNGGHNEYQPNDLHRGMAIAFSVAGYTHEAIAAKIGICRNTMYKHYKKELESSAPEWEFRAINNILQGIKKGDRGDSKWFLQRRTEQFKDRQQIEHSAPPAALNEPPERTAARMRDNVAKEYGLKIPNN